MPFFSLLLLPLLQFGLSLLLLTVLLKFVFKAPLFNIWTTVGVLLVGSLLGSFFRIPGMWWLGPLVAYGLVGIALPIKFKLRFVQVLLVLAALLALNLGISYGVRTVLEKTTSAESEREESVVNEAGGQWVSVSPEGAGFTALFPFQPTVTHLNPKNYIDRTVVIYDASINEIFAYYRVTISTFSDGRTSTDVPEFDTMAFLKSEMSKNLGTVISSEETSFAGLPALRYELHTRRAVIKDLTFMRGNVFYRLEVTALLDGSIPIDAEKFFGSFQLTDAVDTSAIK